MLSFECSNCDNVEDTQNFDYDFDFKTNTLYTICLVCGHRESVVTFKDKQNIDKGVIK